MHWWKVCKILRNPVARMGKLKMGGLGSTNVELSIHNIMHFLQKYTIKGIHGKFEYGDALWGSTYAELSLINMIWEFIKLGGKFVCHLHLANFRTYPILN